MTSINRQLKVLFIEDDLIDVLLIVRHLKQHWSDIEYLQIDSLEELKHALQSNWDVILCDFKLPGFDGMAALRIIREMGVNTPFILVSGEVSEDVAALMMRLGANDYVMKENLKRLGPSILRELNSNKTSPENFLPVQKTGHETEKGRRISDKLLTPLTPEKNKTISERHEAVINMLFVAEYIRKHQAAFLEKHNLTLPRLNILQILKRNYPGSITMAHLKGEMIYKTIDLPRMLEKMKQEGMVDNVHARKSARAREMTITQKGMDALNNLDKHYEEMFLSEKHLTERNAKKINEALQEAFKEII